MVEGLKTDEPPGFFGAFLAVFVVPFTSNLATPDLLSPECFRVHLSSEKRIFLQVLHQIRNRPCSQTSPNNDVTTNKLSL